MDIKHRADARRKSIIEASIALFLKYTAEKVSMDEIAAAARASKVTVYKYFRDKSGLYLSVYSHIEDIYATDVSGRVLGAASVAQRMMNYIDIYTAFISSGYLRLCEELSESDGGVRERFDSFKYGNEKLIAKLIAEAKEQGLIRLSVDSEVIFHYINMGLSYFRHDERYRNSMQSDAGFRREFLKLILGNIFDDFPELA